MFFFSPLSFLSLVLLCPVCSTAHARTVREGRDIVLERGISSLTQLGYSSTSSTPLRCLS